jgi:hypothetical protein
MSQKKDLAAFLLSHISFAQCRILLAGLCDNDHIQMLTQAFNNQEYSRISLDEFTEEVSLPVKPGEQTISGYDVIIILNPYCTLVNPLVLFSSGYARLVENGKLLVIEEKLMPKNNGSEIFFSDRSKTLAERCGFALLYQQDFSHCLTTPGTITVFQKKNQMRWRTSSISLKNVPALLELFHEAFEENISPALWHWKYGDDRSLGVIVWHDEQIVAHFGVSIRPTLFFGTPILAAPGSDVMVKPSERRAFTKKGPFFLAAASYSEAYIGQGAKHLIGFGFPNERHLRLGEKMGIYALVDKMMEVNWMPQSKPKSKPKYTRFTLSPLILSPMKEVPENRAMKLTNRLWEQMSHDLVNHIVGIRDWAYIKYRYFNHPENQYEVFLVHDWSFRRILGIIVLHTAREAYELMDVIGPLKHLPILIAEAKYHVGCRGGEKFFCLANESIVPVFVETGGVAHPLDMNIPTDVWSPGPLVDKVKGKWWLMSGDTDFR